MDLEDFSEVWKEGRVILCLMNHGGVSRWGMHDPQLCGELWTCVHLRTASNWDAAGQDVPPLLLGSSALLEFPQVPGMDFEAFDKLGIFGLFMILVLLNLADTRLNSAPFHSTVSTTTLYMCFMIIPRFVSWLGGLPTQETAFLSRYSVACRVGLWFNDTINSNLVLLVLKNCYGHMAKTL